jgi:hypothetical protein
VASEEGQVALAGALELLRSYGVDRIDHSGRDLLSHLVGTRALLLDWGASPTLGWAGLFHSLFTTEMFDGICCPPQLRDAITANFGAEVMTLVELFGRTSRASLVRAAAGAGPCLDHHTGEAVDVSPEQLRDLFEIHAANAVEQLPHLPEICAVIERERLSASAHLMSDQAWRALSAVADRADPPHVRGQK